MKAIVNVALISIILPTVFGYGNLTVKVPKMGSAKANSETPKDNQPLPCLSHTLTPQTDCLEIGCNKGDRCKTIGMKNHQCCPQAFANTVLTCCFRKSRVKPGKWKGNKNQHKKQKRQRKMKKTSFLENIFT